MEFGAAATPCRSGRLAAPDCCGLCDAVHRGCAAVRSRVRLGRRAELQEAIRGAFDQLAADERYEHEKGYRLAETRDRIKSIQHQIDNLIATMEGLSPVGMAAMHDVGLRHGQDTGRVGLAAW